MLGTLINKELRSIILSPKFTGTFLVCSILILLSVYTGIREYRILKARYDANDLLVSQELQQATSWAHLSTRVYREPEPLQIFASGLDYDIGRWTAIASDSGVKMKHSAYADDPIFAVFRFLDFSFITRFILTLFAILFTYNAVSGEREDGMLKLVFANSVSRAKCIIGKFVGSWLGLVVPITIPILLGILLLSVYGITLSSAEWLRLLLLLLYSLALFTFFIGLGIMISSLCRRSSVSFLISLVAWVMLVMIIPRIGVMAAGHIVEVPRVTDIESRLSSYAQSKWDEFNKASSKRWENYDEESDDNTGDESAEVAVLDEEALWKIIEREDSLSTEVEKDISRYEMKLQEDLRQRKIRQERLAYSLARISPVAAYQFGAMSLAGTGAEIKTRYENAAADFRNRFNDHVEMQKRETGDLGRMVVSVAIDDEGNKSTSSVGGRETGELDLDGLPKFTPPRPILAEAVAPTVIDFGLLVLFSLIVFAGATAAFMRYDMR
ncbi:MAG: ABC transporter permease subunit [candidate division Zixibacteria bacterium]|nr:ABC transporter permease subunit [candidate division Zixibacteria bacterium]